MAKVWNSEKKKGAVSDKTVVGNNSDIDKAVSIGKQKSRIFTMMQYFNHPETGEELFNMDNLAVGLAHKTIKRWSWAIHDKDVWHDFDAPFSKDLAGNKLVAVGDDGQPLVNEIGEKYYVRDMNYVGKTRPSHIHINIELAVQMPLESIAKWFSIPMKYIQLKKGAGTFLDLTEYLTHEADNQQELGKHRYDDEEVHVSDSFDDWRVQLNKRNETRIRYDKDLSLTDYYQMEVFEGRMTVTDILKSEDRDVYLALGTGGANWLDKLYKARATYLLKQDPPTTRVNYYMTGNGGSGKGLLSKALARSLYPDLKDDRDIFYEVGQYGNLFDSYDGQPVIIWNDFRGEQLLKALGSRGDVFNVFESHPTAQRVNKKFSEVMLMNTVNIVNSVQDPADFVTDIVGAKYYSDGRVKVAAEDPNQMYRRFPVFIFVDTEYYQMFVSQGFLDSSKEYHDYVSEEKLKQNLRKAISLSGPNTEIYHAEEKRTTKKIVDKHEELLSPPNGTYDNLGGGEVLERSHATLNFGMADDARKAKSKQTRLKQTRLPIDESDEPF